MKLERSPHAEGREPEVTRQVAEGIPASEEGANAPLLEARDLSKVFEGRKGGLRRKKQSDVHAVTKVSLELSEGSVLGLAGESGSGKTVTAEMLARIEEPTSGSLLYRGNDVAHASGEGIRDFRRKVSMVFQSPFDSMNPRWKVSDAIAEPLRIHKVGTKEERRDAVMQVMERVGLRPADYYADRYPHELSGGELQRAAVARGLILGPDLMIADEPTTMLDVSVRAGILNLLKRMRDAENLAMLFISHDLTTLSYLCDRVAIMYLGRIVEIGPAHDVLGERLHPYTNALAAAVPVEDPDFNRPPVPIEGDLSAVAVPAKGCPFAPRCPERMDICEEVEPALVEARNDHRVACHLYDEFAMAGQQKQNGDTSGSRRLGAPRAEREGEV